MTGLFRDLMVFDQVVNSNLWALNPVKVLHI